MLGQQPVCSELRVPQGEGAAGTAALRTAVGRASCYVPRGTFSRKAWAPQGWGLSLTAQGGSYKSPTKPLLVWAPGASLSSGKHNNKICFPAGKGLSRERHEVEDVTAQGLAHGTDVCGGF